jgi:glycosyltransferase involved in cell wall biosynthesis
LTISIGYLAHCGSKTLPIADWELIVVDNGSKGPLAHSIDLSWHSLARVVREETTGLTYARLRGFGEASADVIVYVDDDNVLASEYLATSHRLASEMPFIGVWSALIRGEFALPVQSWMKPYLPYLALTNFETDRWANHWCGQTLPVGAGMVVRRHVLSTYHERLASDPRRLQLGRNSGSLLAGEDTDIGLAACSLGLGCAYMTGLRVTHLIPASRLQRSYLVRLVEDVTASHRWLDMAQGLPDLNGYARTKLRLKGLLGHILGHRGTFGFEAAVARGHLKASALCKSSGLAATIPKS